MDEEVQVLKDACSAKASLEDCQFCLEDSTVKRTPKNVQDKLRAMFSD